MPGPGAGNQFSASTVRSRRPYGIGASIRPKQAAPDHREEDDKSPRDMAEARGHLGQFVR